MATTTAAPAAAGIRLELQEILRSLSERIRAESAGSVADVRRRARLAEVGAARNLCSLCARFLTGRRGDSDAASFLSPGQIRDVLDSALLDARELKALREEAEATLETLSQDTATRRLDERWQALLAQLAQQEAAAFAEVQEHETTDADAAARALKTCVADMSGVLLDTLCAARDASTDAERRALGEEALAKIERAAGGWAGWFAAAERQAAARTPPELPLSRELSGAMAGDAHLRDLVVSLRHAMKLRRRHARMAAALQRLQSAAAACDAITSLSGSVAEP
jgi:hypothetical protein